MPPDRSSELIAGSMSGVIVSWIVQWFKRSKYLPIVTEDSDRLNKILVVFLGLLMSAGVDMTHTWDPTTHAFALTISGLTMANIGHLASTVYANYVGAKVYYHTVTKPQVAARTGSTVGVIPAVTTSPDSPVASNRETS